jgi:predicted metalloendopeptidase
MVMGHEITHGFDNDGRLYDKDGNRVSWWTNNTIDEFNKRKECIIQQYNNYTMTQVNLQVFHSIFHLFK